MTWIAPDVQRPEGPLTGPERPMLQAFLDWHRATLLYKCSGLTGEQLAERAVPPSALSLLGLVRHMTKVERAWFRQRFAGEPVDDPFGVDRTADFERGDPARAAADYARLTEEFKLADAAVANASLDDEFVHNGAPMSLRLIYLHLIEEYARHLGHADLLRERIDGAIGELPGRRYEQHVGRGGGQCGEDAVVDPAGAASRQDDAMMSRPLPVITAEWTAWMAVQKGISREASRLLPGAEVSSSRTPVMTAAPVVTEVSFRQHGPSAADLPV